MPKTDKNLPRLLLLLRVACCCFKSFGVGHGEEEVDRFAAIRTSNGFLPPHTPSSTWGTSMAAFQRASAIRWSS